MDNCRLDAVRIEELINYFEYDYPQPIGDVPFSVNTEVATCAWNAKHKIVSIGLQGKKVSLDNVPPSNLVFLLDVSGQKANDASEEYHSTLKPFYESFRTELNDFMIEIHKHFMDSKFQKPEE
jgi:hypothetical protein